MGFSFFKKKEEQKKEKIEKEIRKTDVIILKINGEVREFPLNRQSRKQVLNIIKEHIKQRQFKEGTTDMNIFVSSGRKIPTKDHLLMKKAQELMNQK